VSFGREAAAEITKELLGLDRRAAVWLFGSWARGAATEDSDVDTLIVLPDRRQVEEARALCAAASVSAIVTDAAQIERLPAKSPLFALHLASESEPVHASGRPLTVAWDVDQQAKATRRALSRLDAARHEVSVWGPDRSSTQSMVFAAVKEWAMLQAALAGAPEFDRWSALAPLIRRGVHQASFAELEAVWLAKRARRPAPVLTDPERVIADVLEAVWVPAGA
jgi:hypothetical protein